MVLDNCGERKHHIEFTAKPSKRITQRITQTSRDFKKTETICSRELKIIWKHCPESRLGRVPDQTLLKDTVAKNVHYKLDSVSQAMQDQANPEIIHY